MQPLSALVGDAPSLEDLEQLLGTLYATLVARFGAATAAQVLGRTLAGASQPQPQPPAALPPRAPTTTDAAAAPAGGLERSGSGVSSSPSGAEGAGAAGGVPSRLRHAVSFASDVSDTSDASDVSARVRWHRAVALALGSKPDPWAGRALHKLPMEVATRYRYTASTRAWVKDEVLVKMEGRPFAAGAMRECYALKKLSTFSSSVYRDWKKAPNFVAKRYKKPVDRSVYFSDTVLQMDSKFLGDEYNRTQPPKKVDVMQAAVLEFKDRPGRPLMCVEHLIEGDYVKYNSNSGYVASAPQPLLPLPPSSSAVSLDSSGAEAAPPPPPPSLALSRAGSGVLGSSEQTLRNTPQAFSHFSYTFTQGTALCVDIQGVADLYTDPQIHTLDGQGYGDGNLGLRGMALFFRSHECNPLCSKLKLPPFERCATDVAAQGYTSSSSTRSGTIYRSFSRHRSILSRLEQQRQSEQQPGPSHSLQDLLARLEAVPERPSPHAFIHWEVARIYAETVTLPELRPEEDPDAARAGGLFHLVTSAALSNPLAQLQLACGHLGLEPSSTQLAHLLKEGRAAGDFEQHPALALRYTQLAAERGCKGAAAALAHAYATGGGVGAGVLPGPLPAAAVSWLRRALADGSDAAGSPELFAATPDGLNPRSSGKPPAGASTAAAAAAVTPKSGVMKRLGSRALRGSLSPAPPPSPLVGPDGVPIGSLFAIADKLSQAAAAALATTRNAFDAAAEEEAQLLPGGAAQRYELWAQLGELLLRGSDAGSSTLVSLASVRPAVLLAAASADGDDSEEASLLALAPDPAAAADAFNAAAEEASAAFKGKLAQRYYEAAAQAEAAAEEAAAGGSADDDDAAAEAGDQYEDPTILFVGEPELVELKLVEDEPLVVVQSACQQIKCTRDKFGNVVDGDPNSIQHVFYFWGLQQEASGVVLPSGQVLPPRWSIRDMMWQGHLALV